MVASEAKDEAMAFSDLDGLQTALEVKCKLILMVALNCHHLNLFGTEDPTHPFPPPFTWS